MHMGGLAIIGEQAPANFKHIVFNNGAHDSVGGQPTAALGMDVLRIALACGYRTAEGAESADEIRANMAQLTRASGPAMLEIRVNKGARADLGRPKASPAENKRELMGFFGV